jgi:NADH:ubiquinone oxidoreductase subunit E
MLKVTICVGSSCSVRGSEEVAAALEQLIEREKLSDKVELVGAFCMEMCSTGVSIKVGQRQYREVHPEDAEVFFYKEIWPLVSEAPAGGGAL